MSPLAFWLTVVGLGLLWLLIEPLGAAVRFLLRRGHPPATTAESVIEGDVEPDKEEGEHVPRSPRSRPSGLAERL